MTPQYYIAFVLDRAVHSPKGRIIIEAGVDVLAGPFATRVLAAQALRDTCAAHPRLAAFAALATALVSHAHEPPARIEVIAITPAMVDAYHARHAVALPWPLPVVSPAQTNTPDKTPKKTCARKRRRTQKKGEVLHATA